MNQANEVVSHKSKIYTLSRTAIMAAVICILAPLSIPIGPIPISFTNLAIYFSLYLLGWKLATGSYITYLLIGMIGLPVFSGFTGGVAKLLGPTGGYIIGFIPMAILAGFIIDRYKNRTVQFLGMVFGTILCYGFGTIWFCFQTGTTFVAALGLCVFPFIPGDLIKIIITMIVGPIIRNRLIKAGLIEES